MLKKISIYLSENPTLRYWIIRPEWVAVILLILSIIASLQLSPFFGDLAFIMDSATPYVEYGLIAIILTLIIISGEIDLSIASMIALTAVIFGTVYNAGFGMLFSVLIGVLSGALCGLFNGILVTKLKIPSIILTIGTLTLYRGIAQALASDFSLGGYPSWFIGIDYRYVGIIPIPVIIFTVFALIVGFLLSSTIYGKQLYLIGTNPQTAKYSGIKVDKIKLLLFTFSGVISGVAGVLTTSRLAVARFNMATGAELEIVLMVMLGGTYIFGGRGNIFGTFVAFWIVVILRSGFNVARIKIESQLTILGAMLIIAIILTNYIYSKSQK
ncbi:MAG: ABC transporter permease [Pelagibacteraceae bacterium]|nr:ABC transporter permease [Pelagibacteraceae bacterium]MBT4952052.1 ABC transporter permease [Pelagibacteraceae bacterium]